MKNDFFRYKVNDKWITAKKCNGKIYILEPNAFELYELNELQGELIFQMKCKSKSIKEIFEKIGVNISEDDNAVKMMLDLWRRKGII